MLASVIETGRYTWLVVLAVLFAAVSVYYYFRVIQAMYFKTGEPQTETITGSFKIGLIVLIGPDHFDRCVASIVF